MIEKRYIATFEDGTFKKLFLMFIQYKQGLGFKYDGPAQNVLIHLNKQLNTYHLDFPVLRQEAVEDLAARRNQEAPATQSKRISLLRHFGEFLNHMGYEAYIYPHHCNVKFSDGFAPYIFSHQQINAIILAADSLEFTMRSPHCHLVWPAFIRVLYGCGLRLTEALSLKVLNVDLATGVLYIEKSKNGTSRYVPSSASLKDFLEEYAIKMNLNMTGPGYFFPAPDNGRYGANTAYQRVKKLYAKAGIPILSNGRYPRVHDVRHSFSCHALEKMQQDGFDLYYSLPILCAYLGHQGIRDTERYLRLPSFQYGAFIEAVTSVLGGIVPEVTDDEKN